MLHVSATRRPGPMPGKSVSKSELKLRPKRRGMELIPRLTQEITTRPTTTTVVNRIAPRTISRRHLSQKSFIGDQLPRRIAYKLHSPTGAGKAEFLGSGDPGLATCRPTGCRGHRQGPRHDRDSGQGSEER